MTSDNNTRTLAARTVRAFHPGDHAHTTPAAIELLRHGPGVRAGDPAGDTRWEVRVTINDEPTVSCTAGSTWGALLLARIELEQRGWHLAIAAARRDHTVLDPDRQRESTTVSELTDAGRSAQPGIFQDADPSTIGTVDEQAQHRTAWIERRYGTTAATHTR
ncbi:hypothetical protein [Lentzea terrae]|uniref:hypothetical protein n=1 Tax=Lentzea terrae TaxID=2200761 RepID=UPI000DD46297|nr:hypothetical protein [Lentzea terrae]